ncbi:MAG: error-prone polymerase [Gaiellales bacterium]|nr:error-prone polymerase [Gaiellales bacterium]
MGAADTPYAELHCHSTFSFLDGASQPEELALQAAELGLEALALTDHDNLCGALVFAQAARDVGVRPITGAELTVRDRAGRFHVTVLCETAHGYRNLCRAITEAHRADRLRPELPLALLEEHAEGLIALTGCPRQGALVHADRETALARGRSLRDAFGPERLRVELTRPLLRGDRARLRTLHELARTLDLATVVTNDVHVHQRRRAALQDALVAIRCGLPLEACEAERRGNREHVLKGPAELAALFADVPEAVAEAARVAQRCQFDLTRDLGYRYPSTDDADRELARVCAHALHERYGSGGSQQAAAASRLGEELELIAHHRLAGFFLLHREILELAREIAVEVRGPSAARQVLPPGRGRGSSVGSIVCYLTGLSHVDPVSARLSLGRFLNREMASAPDIDLDFPRDVRSKLIPAVHARYGRDRSALIAAFATYRSRGAIRELGKVLGLPAPDLDRLARASDGHDAERVGAEIASLPGVAERSHDRRFRALAFLAAEIAGLPRHLSQHSGGMVVSTGRLDELVPLVPAAMAERQICQWDKDSCADAGFLKIDLLGLGMLSAVEECVDQIARHTGETIDLSRIPLDDPEVYAEVQLADTVGTFQIESRAQMQMLLRTRPESLDDLTVEVALVRPGPIQGGAVHPYLHRREALRADPGYAIPYDHPLLEEPLRDTLGVIVYQDQVLDVAVALAGFTHGQAEGLRRAMSRRRSREALASHWHAFRDGAAERGVPEATANLVFEQILAFSAFGFPKSHAAAFGLLAFQSAWLHRHHPAAFLSALLNAQPLGFYPPATLVRDGMRRGVEVRKIDVNRSSANSLLEQDGAVRLGLRHIRGLGEPAADLVVREREHGGAYRDLADLTRRTALDLPRLELLIAAGACDELGRRRELRWQLGLLSHAVAVRGGHQLALDVEVGSTPRLAALCRWEALVADYRATGISIREHPLAQLRAGLLARGLVSTADLPHLPDGTPIAIAGLAVARQRPASAKGIVFLLVEDEHGMVNLVLYAQVYEAHRLLARTEPLLEVHGRLERRDRNINVLVETMYPVGRPGRPAIAPPVRQLAPAPESEAMDALRMAAPGAHHFAQGRR